VVPISFTIFAYIVTAILSAAIGVAGYEYFRRKAALARRTEADEQAHHIVQAAQREADTVLKEAKLEAKDLVFQARTEVEKEQKAQLADLANVEKRIAQREESIEKKLSALEQRERDTAKRDQDLVKRE
jgi:ribonuclease Y